MGVFSLSGYIYWAYIIYMSQCCVWFYSRNVKEVAERVAYGHIACTNTGPPALPFVQEGYYMYREIDADSEEATGEFKGPNQWPPVHLVPG